MAAEPHSSTRRHVLGAAAALPVLAVAGLPAAPTPLDRRTWDQRLGRYRRLHTRWKAEAETGAYRAANDAYYRARAELTARFGSWEKARRSRTGNPLCTAAFARVSDAEDTYYDNCTAPMYRAAARLVGTPAPDLHALLAKIDVIREYGLEPHDDIRRHPIDLLREDVERLGNDQGGHWSNLIPAKEASSSTKMSPDPRIESW